MRRPFVTLYHDTVGHNTGLQVPPNQLQDPLVRYSMCQATHQNIVIDPVKVFLKVDIHHPFMPLGDVGLGLPQRLVRIPARPEPIAMGREGRLV